MEQVFGDVVDTYTMKESVADGITVNLVYEGRAAKVFLDHKKIQEIEAYYAKCEAQGANENQIEQSKKAVTNLEAILRDPDVINEIAKDFVAHYEQRVKEGASVLGKAMFVCSSREVAFDLWKAIVALHPEWNEKKVCSDGAFLTEQDKKELKPIEKIKMVMTENKAKDVKEIGRADAYKLTEYGRVYKGQKNINVPNKLQYINYMYSQHNYYKYKYGVNDYAY